MIGKTIFIAEVKTQSPFGYRAQKSWEELFDIANTHGDWLSIHTDPRWGGSFELLAKARKLTQKPILAKGIHATDDDVRRAALLGADFVLVVGRTPSIYSEKIIVEPLDRDALKKIPQEYRVLWNSRDLVTGELKKGSFADAKKLFNGWLVQASNIRGLTDIQKGADAVLVGTHLEEFIKSLK
ncbi:MAG: hypothetical protein EXS68_01340 [Candidatus Ryanbacteria bacterium]|nr:hypothetical protein [Candidatus Ryanbacteria bacterium]